MAGPYYFAFADAEETEFGPEHHREDVKVISFDLSQRENDFALLTIVIRNPRRGLLNPDDKQWLWFARDYGDGPEPEFFGRIMGAPSDLGGPHVSLQFVARPLDFEAMKADLAEELKEPPYWDAIFVHPDHLDDPDAVLQARTDCWHTDRVSHELSVSDKLNGEDGVLGFGAADVLYTSLSMRLGVPVTTVTMNAEINYTQSAQGSLDITRDLVNAFRAAGSAEKFGISSYTMDGLISSWPLPGDSFGGGWSIAESDLIEGRGTFVSAAKAAQDQITVWGRVFDGAGGISSPSVGVGLGSPLQSATPINFPLGVVIPTLVLKYEAKRSRVETVSFTLTADMQATRVDAGDQATIALTLSSNQVSEPIDAGATDLEIPIGDVRRRSYLLTDRGRETVEHLIARARAELLDHARAVEVPFDVRIAHLRDVTLRKNATVAGDPRLPGGTATGKIVAYRATGDGNTGVFRLALAIGCAVGRGNTVVAVPGTPVYVEDDYVEPDYQVHLGGKILVAGDVTYGDYQAIEPADDGINFFDVRSGDVIESLLVTNGPAAQRNVMQQFYPDVAAAVAAMEAVFTRVCLTMKPVTGGPFTTAFPLTVSALMVPKQIDLEADPL